MRAGEERSVHWTALTVWGAVAGSVLLSGRLLVRHLEYPTAWDLLRDLAAVATLIFLVLAGFVWLLRKGTRRFSETGEALEVVVGGLATINCGVIALVEVLRYSSLALGWVATAIFALIGNVALVFASMQFRGARDWTPGWSLRLAVLAVWAWAALFYARFVISELERPANDWTELRYLAVCGVALLPPLVLLRRPRGLVRIIQATVAGVALLVAAHAFAGMRGAVRHALQNSGRVEQVMLLTVDTLRYDMVMRPGGTETLAPSMRALAEGGVNFECAVSPAPWTLTSFASMMTGLEPLVHGRTRDVRRLPGHAVTLAERFRAAGFRTRAVILNYNLHPSVGLNQGFDEYRFANTDRVDTALEMKLRRVLGDDFRLRFPSDGTTEITRIAQEWIRELRGQRYFLWIHYLDPHVPYEPPDGFVAEESTREFGRKFSANRDEWGAPGFFSPARKRWSRDLYEAEVRYVDQSIGQLLDALRETGQDKKALLVLTSDHGEEFWEHGGFEHGHTLYQELLHVPLVVRAPGLPEGLSVRHRVAVPQIAPTILDLCGLPWEVGEFDYPSLMPLSESGQVGGVPERIWSGRMLYGDEQRAFIEGGLKLVVRGDSELTLHDLDTDPGERENLAPSRAEEAAAMFARLQAHEAAAAERADKLGFAADAEKTELAPEMIEGLKDLGYM